MRFSISVYLPLMSSRATTISAFEGVDAGGGGEALEVMRSIFTCAQAFSPPLDLGNCGKTCLSFSLLAALVTGAGIVVYGGMKRKKKGGYFFSLGNVRCWSREQKSNSGVRV